MKFNRSIENGRLLFMLDLSLHSNEVESVKIGNRKTIDGKINVNEILISTALE